MMGNHSLVGKRGILALLVVAVMAFGQVPVGTLAFADTQVDGGPDAGETPVSVRGGVVRDGLGTPTITVTAPVAGTTSSDTAPVVTAESGAGYSVSNTKWCDADGRPLADPVTFEAGQTYYLSAQLTPTATSGTESYFRTSNVTCNGGDVVRMFNGTRMMDGRLVFISLEPVISVTATGAAQFVDLCVGANSNNGDVQFSYTYIGRTATGTISGSVEMGCGPGSILTLTAVPKENYEFVGWFSANYTTSGEVLTPSGDAIATSPTITLTIAPLLDQSAFCAVFAETAPVEVALSGTIATFGTTTVNGTTVNTAAGEKANVPVGQPATIVITPKPGYMVTTPSVPVDQPSDFSYQQNADSSAMTITFTQPEGGVRVEAWIAERIAVTYDVNGGTKGSAWPENDLYKYVAHGTYTRFTAPATLDPSFATPPEGMKYAGYQIGSETVAPGENSSFGIVTSPLSIKLLWEPDESQPVVCGLYISPNGPNGSATIEYTDYRTGLPNSFTLHGHSLQAVRAVYGTDVTLTAEPDEGYSLKGWFVLDQNDPNDDEWTLVSTDTTYTYTATEQTILTAEFEHVHSWSEWTVTTEPTCTEPGEETRECTFCGEKETREIAALGHEWGEWTVTTEPTCTEAGFEQRVCTHDASHVETRDIDALGHDWGKWTVTAEATETEDGVETRTCANDPSHTETRAIPHLSVVYRNTEGDGATWTKGSGVDLAFTFKRNIDDDATFGHFTGVRVDGDDVDSSSYSAVAGSAVVTLKAGYLEGLSEGEHTVTALFDDGDGADASFTVVAAAEEPPAEDPSDGEGTEPAEEPSDEGGKDEAEPAEEPSDEGGKDEAGPADEQPTEQPEDEDGAKPAEETPAEEPSDGDGARPVEETPADGDGKEGAESVGEDPAKGGKTSPATPRTGDQAGVLPALLVAMALCGAAMLFAGSLLRPVRSRGKDMRR